MKIIYRMNRLLSGVSSLAAPEVGINGSLLIYDKKCRNGGIADIMFIFIRSRLVRDFLPYLAMPGFINHTSPWQRRNMSSRGFRETSNLRSPCSAEWDSYLRLISPGFIILSSTVFQNVKLTPTANIFIMQ